MYEYYEILGVDRDADVEMIEAAFRERVRELHPDQDGDREELVQLKRARAVLTDPAQRKDYDRLGHRDFVERERSAGPADVDLRSGSEPRQATADDTDRRGRRGPSTRSRSRSSRARESGSTHAAPTEMTDQATERAQSRGHPDHRRAADDPDQAQSRQSEASTQPAASSHEAVVDLDEVADVGSVDPDEILDDSDSLAGSGSVGDSNAATVTDDGQAESSDRSAPREDSSVKERAPDRGEQPNRAQQPREPISATTAQPEPQNQDASPEQAGAKPQVNDESTGDVAADHDEFRATSPTPSDESATPARDASAPDQSADPSTSSEQAQTPPATDSVSTTPDDPSTDGPSETSDPAGFGADGANQTGSGHETIESGTKSQNGFPSDDPQNTPSDPFGDEAAEPTESSSIDEDESHARGASPTGFKTHGEESQSTEQEWTAANSGGSNPHGSTGDETHEWDTTSETPSGTTASAGQDSFGMAETTETDGGTQSSPGVVHRIVAPVLAVPGAITAAVPLSNISGAIGALHATAGDDYRTEEVEQMAAYAWVGRIVIAAVVWVPLALLAPDTGIIPGATGSAVGVAVLSMTVSFLLYDLLLRYGADLTPGCHGPMSTAPPVRGVGGLVVLYLTGLIAVGAAVFDAPALRSFTTSSVTLSAIETTVRTAPYHTGLAVIGAGIAAASFSTLAVVWWYLPWSDRFDRGYRVLPGWWQLPVPVAGLLLVWAVAGGTATVPVLDVGVGSGAALGVVGALPVVAVLYLVWRTLREPDTTTTW